MQKDAADGKKDSFLNFCFLSSVIPENSNFSTTSFKISRWNHRIDSFISNNTFISIKFIYSPNQHFILNIKVLAAVPSGDL